MSDVLPALNTVYRLLDDFQLDILERGAEHKVNMRSTKSLPGERRRMHCTVRIKGAHCKFSVKAERADEEEGYKVTEVQTRHDCSFEERESMWDNTEDLVRGRIAELKGAMKENGNLENGNVNEPEILDRPGSTRIETRSDKRRKVNEHETTQGNSSEGERKVDEDACLGSGSETSSDEPISAPKTPYRPKSPASYAFHSLCPPARDVKGEVDELKSDGHVQLPSTGAPFDSLRQLLIVLFAYSQQRDYSIVRRYPKTQFGIRDVLIMDCYRSGSRYKDAPNGGRCKFQLHGSKAEDGKWRFEKVVGSHNHPVLELTQGNDQTREGNERAKEGDGCTENEAKLDSTKFQPFALPASRLPHASTSTLPSLTSTSIMAPPPPRLVTTTSTASSLSYPPDLVSFLRAFDSSPSNLAHTLITLHSSGINDLDTLVSILAMEEENLARFVEMLSNETVGKRILEMAADLRERAV